MALEPVKYTTHSRETEAIYLKIVKGSDEDTTWLIIGPDANKEYGPEVTGNDFSQFLQSFEEGKVQYGLARVSPPGSDVEKIILIGWCPDSAPMKTRASFASNFGTIANNVLKGYHVQVSARDEDDLDEHDILMKISNAAGARYSIQTTGTKGVAKKPAVIKKFTPTQVDAPKKLEEPVRHTEEAPKPLPKREPSKDDDDWGEPEVKERDFDANPIKPAEAAYKPIGKVDLQKVIAEENAKEDPRLVQASDASKSINAASEINNLKEQSKLERDREMDELLGTKPPLTVNNYEKDLDKVNKGFSNEKSPAQLWAEKKAAQSGVPPREHHSPVREEEPDLVNLKNKFDNLSVKEEEPTPSLPTRDEEPPAPSLPTREEPALPSRDEPSAPSLPTREEPPAPSLPTREEPPAPTLPTREEPPAKETAAAGPSAVAEYDYDAAEDNELTFKENDKILNIEFVDEDWWLGELESGEKGLFPSNYVTLQE